MTTDPDRVLRDLFEPVGSAITATDVAVAAPQTCRILDRGDPPAAVAPNVVWAAGFQFDADEQE